MVVFAGQGDARRSMDLLWRGNGPAAAVRRPGPGPRPGLTVDAIVEAAVAVADADGMPALSMRAVGERLGRTAMALYTYVPGKSELVDLMYDQVLAELPAGYPQAAGWRAAVTAWADDSWAFHLRHPWVLQVSQARPVLGPNEYRALEALIGALAGTGLPGGRLRRIVGALVGYVRGSVRTAAEAREAAAATGVGDDEWWFGRASLLAEVAPDFAERFPLLAALEQDRTAAFEQDDSVPYQEREARETFTAGLAVLLDGVEAAIARAVPPA
ncbi:TetR/AcrR family transcriptional regulator C-terminal domain-containing protein [Kitasatospora sp. NBC_00374]|uniref:TetR/AcrR family transcriptional regulator C-terminal domain-containing protein n=1 Tax=Kitasatospora sp. NBC_00374 TaxID=2975964 RepID=UPI0030DFAB81